MSDSVKVILIFYGGFILSLLISNILVGVISRSIRLIKKIRVS